MAAESQTFVITRNNVVDPDTVSSEMESDAASQAEAALGDVTLGLGTFKWKQGDTPIPNTKPPQYYYNGSYTVTATQVEAEPTPAPEPTPTPEPTPNKTPPAAEEPPAPESAATPEVPEIVVTAPRIKVDETASKPVNKIRENPLSKFSSSSYNISLYMINPSTFNLYASGGKAIPKDWQLICRSGGINNTSSRGNESPRADGFELDYYIDNLRIVTAISSKETQTSTNSFDFSFQVYEPHGFKFPSKLVAAAKQVQANSQIKKPGDISETIVALKTQFMLVVRFYGYDTNGQLIKGTDFPQPDLTRTDPEAVFERSFPIQISAFEFKLDSKMVTYNIKAKMVSEQMVLGRLHGFLEDNITIKGSTVREALEGSTKENPKAGVMGLMQALNEKQEALLKAKQIAIKDEYKIIFEENAGISEAFLVDVENTGKEKTATTTVTGSGSSNDRTANKPAIVYKRTRPYTINKGDSVLTAIDQIITQSSYISRAFKIKDTERISDASGDNADDYVKNNPETIAWYKVVPEVELGEYDDIREMYACNITYVICRYEVPHIKSASLGNRSKYPGPHKRYKHWYMSNDLKENLHQKEVIGYEQGYNLLYFNAAGYGNDAPAQDSTDKATSAPVAGAANSTGKLAGTVGKTLGPIKTFLYSPADQLKARITILGDPDYLMTSTSRGYEIALQKWHGEDGWSINPNSGQVFIEIDFRNAEDYDLATGLLNPSQDGDIVFWKYPDSVKKDIQGIAYMVWQVTSTFAKGVFTQELKTSLPSFDDLGTDKSEAGNKDQRGATKSNANLRPTMVNDPRLLTNKPVNNMVTPTSLGQGVQNILKPPNIQTTTPTLTQIQNSTAYTSARMAGKTPADAIEIAKQSFATGTSNEKYSAAAPAPITKTVGVVNDDATGGAANAKTSVAVEGRGK